MTKMTNLLPESFSNLNAEDKKSLLTFNRGIEREALRVTPGGKLADTPHPETFGSKLTHPLVTTDFSEAQLELITPVFPSAEGALQKLDEVHRYVYSGVGDEILWSASMPCMLDEDASIPLAFFGDSNLGRLKTTYRSGLGHRYGRGMQTICAVHYNFSLSDEFWSWLKDAEGVSENLKDFTTRRYFDLMRNFRRYSWMLTYLFGASPAVCKSFVKDKAHTLEDFDEGTLYLPYATSLRSGNLGYQSDTQADQMNICYNTLDNYVSSLASAICAPHDAYEAINARGEYPQVNANLLQSEAEFYSSIRAKRVPSAGENFLGSLLEHGVQYIEVRLLDVNPYLPLGIDESEIRFLDTFLLYCLMTPSPEHDQQSCDDVRTNSMAVVHNGRSPDLTLIDQGTERPMQAWAAEILDEISPWAELLGSELSDPGFIESFNLQVERVRDPAKTPSGQILGDLKSEGVPFFRFAMNQALAHRESFNSRPLDEQTVARYAEIAADSVAGQNDIEAKEQISFDEYLAGINANYQPLV
ncbi:MAG: glutamate--cysteine ligase [Pseudomonadales bacterium]|nr:glutamate--cysteine ligase [Pseudomonadales bacterium]